MLDCWMDEQSARGRGQAWIGVSWVRGGGCSGGEGAQVVVCGASRVAGLLLRKSRNLLTATPPSPLHTPH